MFIATWRKEQEKAAELNRKKSEAEEAHNTPNAPRVPAG